MKGLGARFGALRPGHSCPPGAPAPIEIATVHLGTISLQECGDEPIDSPLTGELLGARRNPARPPQGSELATLLLEAREERQLTRLRSQLAKLDLLVLDELGYVPASKVGAELLFDLISTAYERSSMVVTTNRPFEEGKEVLGSERLTGATLDRLTHRCTIVETGKESYRLRDARRRRRGEVARPAEPTVDAGAGQE